MTGLLEEYDEPQDALDEKATELYTNAERLDSVLDQYDEGWRTEQEVLEVAEDANQAYNELDEIEDELLETEYSPEKSVEDIAQSLQELGYDSLNDYIEGREPLTASSNTGENSLVDTEDDIDWTCANQAHDRYNQVTDRAREEYGINVPLADSIQNSETSEMIDQLSAGELAAEDIEL